MEGDNLNDIIDVGGFSSDLKTVIDGISSLEAKIAEANEMSIAVGVDLKGVENINELTAGIKLQADAIKALTAVQQDNSAVVQQMAQVMLAYGDSAATVSRQINSTGNEVRQLTKDLQSLADMQVRVGAGSVAYRQLAEEIANVTGKLGELQNAVKNAWGMAGSRGSNFGQILGSVRPPAKVGAGFNAAIGIGAAVGDPKARSKMQNDAQGGNEQAAQQKKRLEREIAALHVQLSVANEKNDIASIDKVALAAKEKYEQLQKELANTAHVGAKLAAGRAYIAAGNAAFGLPDYGKMTAAADAETEAKKESAKVQFQDFASKITDSTQVIEAQKQVDEQLIQIDRDAYQKRLGLATEYFQAIAKKIGGTTNDNQILNKARHFGNMTSILQGRGSDASKDYQLFKEDIGNQKADARIQLEGINSKIPAAQEAFSKADAATKGPLSDDAQSMADDAKSDAKANLDTLYTRQKEQNFKLEELDKQLADKKKEYQKAIMSNAVQLANETVSAIATITDNQIAGQQQQLQIQQQQQEVYNQQKTEGINATTNYQITKDNLLATQAAQNANVQNQLQAESNQLMLKKAKADKTAAEAGIIAHTAEGIAQAFAEYPYLVAIPIAALIAATGAVQYAAAASAPLPQFAAGGITKTPLFIAGEAGPEIIAAPGKAPYITDGASIHNEPIGTEVIPLHKMYEYAVNNAGNARYDASMQQIYNNEVMMKEVTKIIGEKFEIVGEGIENSIARNRVQQKVNIYAENNRLQYNRK